MPPWPFFFKQLCNCSGFRDKSICWKYSLAINVFYLSLGTFISCPTVRAMADESASMKIPSLRINLKNLLVHLIIQTQRWNRSFCGSTCQMVTIDYRCRALYRFPLPLRNLDIKDPSQSVIHAMACGAEVSSTSSHLITRPVSYALPPNVVGKLFCLGMQWCRAHQKGEYRQGRR